MIYIVKLLKYNEIFANSPMKMMVILDVIPTFLCKTEKECYLYSLIRLFILIDRLPMKECCLE